MNKTDAIRPRGGALVSPGSHDRRNDLPFPDRRHTPRPPLVVTRAVRTVEFLIVAALGFAIYLAYVDYDAARG
jgi:hypothetical protein